MNSEMTLLNSTVKIIRTYSVQIVLVLSVVVASILRVVFLDTWMPVFVDEAAFLVPGFSLRTANTIFSASSWQNQGVYQLYSLVFYISEKPDIALYFSRLFYSAIPGVAAVILSYFIIKQFYSKRIALLSALLLAINPFHVLYSRISILYSFSLFLYLLIFYFFSRGLKQGSKLSLILSFLFLFFAVQLSLPTVEICLLMLFVYLVLHISFMVKSKKQIFTLKALKSRYVLLVFSFSAILIVFLIIIGTIPFFLSSLRNIPLPENGFERMFGFDSVDHLIFSINHIASYMIGLNTPPILLLSLGGFAYGLYKRNILVISWSIVIMPGFFYGYYSRRLLFSVPLTMLLSSVAVFTIWERIPMFAIKMKKVFKTKLTLDRFLPMVMFGLMFVICANSLFVSYSYVSDFPSSNAPGIERDIYVSRYTSGYGIQDSINHIESLSTTGLIVTDTPQQFTFYLLNRSSNFEVRDLGSVEISPNGLFQVIENSSKPVFFAIRWWNWVNDYLGNLSLTEPGYPIKLSKIIEIPQSTIDNEIMIYSTGKNPVWKLQDPQFQSQRHWAFNSSDKWHNSIVGWPEFVSEYNITQFDNESVEIKVKGNSIWAWTDIGVSQDTDQLSLGNLTFAPLLTVDNELLSQTEGAYLRVQVDLFDGANYRSIVYVNSYLDYDFPSDVFKNGSSAVYFVRKIPLGAWNQINLDILTDYDDFFIDKNYNYGLSQVFIGASASSGNLDFLLRKAEIIYRCIPWVIS